MRARGIDFLGVSPALECASREMTTDYVSPLGVGRGATCSRPLPLVLWRARSRSAHLVKFADSTGARPARAPPVRAQAETGALAKRASASAAAVRALLAEITTPTALIEVCIWPRIGTCSTSTPAAVSASA